MYDIYSNARNDMWRFTLGRNGSRKLITIGLNPSTATQESSDTTVAKVEGVAMRNDFDGFVMLNLYPVRATNFNRLPHDVDDEAFSENLNRIEELFDTNPNSVVWAAWGENIHARIYFANAARELFSRLQTYGITWRHFGLLTNSGHPRHPSRLHYSWSFSDFDIHHYDQILST
ncbi:MAG: DUF1643 domain-containing protein [Thiofilum sp.]|uniref:DUF1643 domain-containing protein n=1 Tax=Thiofilum sp. TaxID=2212733 RepID=UPI0025EE00F9|nr:DUF1643 domain-containing protein [Thiofilum sp.]MBK8452614.1 DUF1643 domain-containing protein [Thiofilum sp.]